jgi:4-hydroxy-tetrahydrodipicolinate synthase
MDQRLGIMQGLKDAGLPLRRFLVGTGLCNLEETAVLTRAAADLGFAGALVVPPFYYRDPAPEGLIVYYDALVAKVNHAACAIYLYHIPQNTSVPLPIEVVTALHGHHPETIVGLKDSAGDLAYSRAIARALPTFDVFPSSETSLGSSREDGFAGVISGTTNITAEESQTAWQAPDTAAGKAALVKAGERRAALTRGGLIANVKSALADRYADPEWSRVIPPMRPITPHQAEALREALALLAEA